MAAADLFSVVQSNAGPNSGHTSYMGDEKIVLMQLPTFSVIASRMGIEVMTYLNAGAVIDVGRIMAEIDDHNMKHVFIDPEAAVVRASAVEQETDLKDRVGSTGKGTGAAIAAKVMREEGAVAKQCIELSGATGRMSPLHFGATNTFVEVSQGYSLSLNASGMYPYCTSRDCTVGAALSDAGIHPEYYRGSMMVVRTYPIRVAGNSGPGYEDQEETSFEEIGVEPKFTTVTQKKRRVFTFSATQFRRALVANRPDALFINFLNYLKSEEDMRSFVEARKHEYADVMGKKPELVLGGFGPLASDVRVL
jgi:adenylosuccinate synthase